MTSSQPRSAVVDLGSNSVRLVVFEGAGRNPVPIFNERAVLRLGAGLTDTGRLNEAGVAQAVRVMRRYHAVAREMHAAPNGRLEVLATAAVRDAANGPDFVRQLLAVMPGAVIRILSGEEEAAYSADGVVCGIPDADGILADIGGGSLELVQLQAGMRGEAVTLKLGVIRLHDRAAGDLARARKLAEADLAEVEWLPSGLGGTLYLVGGAFRALARVHMTQVNYPLTIVHHYALDAETARTLATDILEQRKPDRVPGVSRRRQDDLPYAALVLRRLLRASGAARVVFSANGLREGWYMHRLPPATRDREPLLTAARDTANTLARDPTLPPVLCRWTANLFADESAAETRLREAACWMSDAGSHDHPDYRAEQAFLRILRQPGMALDHAARAFLALSVAHRYEIEPDAPCLARLGELLPQPMAQRAQQLGLALRLAYTLSAGTPHMLSATRIGVEGATLVLRLEEAAGVFAGDGVIRRLRRLAESLGLENAETVGGEPQSQTG